ncbi:hypothetical protein DNTS_009038 [Danionella cerebrum]|uniref:28S ribosomal protein S24, mitochondrial n=1 Tax=Danionella cerebrum TaxID=2873325 RepID=A0A553MQ68_9TELE|nr:hypothetical protein DNTS_009038 [Danionella translucida]
MPMLMHKNVFPQMLESTWHVRSVHISAVCLKNRAARIRISKGDRPLTYEQTYHPHHIGHLKGWLSQHTGNLHGEDGAAQFIIEDVFVRRFIFGTFCGCLADELVLKRRGNQLIICAILNRKLATSKIYFLVGYVEELLSHFYKIPVKLELQIVNEKNIYKYV